MTFFSGTDVNTLKEEGKDRNNFVSLIVNNAGTYTAAITRKVMTKYEKKLVNYSFFGSTISFTPTENEETEELEYYYLDITKEMDASMSSVVERLDEIKKSKQKQPPKQFTLFDFNESKPISKKEETSKPYLSEYIEEDSVGKLDYDSYILDDEFIESIIKKLFTCSLVIPDESKINLEKWAVNMPKLYDKIFKTEQAFRDWADVYVEYITWNINNCPKKLERLSQDEIQSIVAYNMLYALENYESNKYIEYFKELLGNYII